MTVAEIMQWYEQWYRSDEGEAFRKEVEKRAKEQERDEIHYNCLVESDGSFKILDVRPGEYRLSGELRKADAKGMANYKEPVVAEIKHTFTVDDITEENQDVPVELGIVQFFPAAKLEPNQPIPDFSVGSLDGGMLKLADFRGKYLLLTFYTVAGQETLKEDMANLKQIQDDFADNENFEMMGLTHGGLLLHEELVKKFLAEQELTWQQGFMDRSSYELMNTYNIRNWPHSLLIDPNGVLIVDGLKGTELYEAIAKALAK